MRPSPIVSAVPFLLVACSGHAPPAGPALAPAVRAAASRALPAPPPAPQLRLGDAAIPRRYAVELTIQPAAPGFDGVVDIDVELTQPTTGIWLHAAEIEVKDATLTFGGQSSAARVLPNPPRDQQHLGLGSDRVVGPGPAHLRIAFHGKLQDNETVGAFRQQSGGDWYVFTQFESGDARRAFPCFDEPSFKTPWRLTLRVPRDVVAVANDAVASETVDGELKTVRFAETRPLPSYLIAFAVGPFDIVDAGQAKGGAPIRILTLKGRGAEAAWAVESTKPILDLLEEYFGMPYPFAKLDQIAIPKTVAFGAMENPGLVTYVETSLLARPEDDTVARKHRYASTAAHELAHMWFGDLVTLAWWNDTWLNESFATWTSSKIMSRWQPAWGGEVDMVAARTRSLGLDSFTTARAVRQPIENENDIANAFDGITYFKGAAVLRMAEAWIGADTFQKGVRQYLHDHAYGNATASDFFAAISAAAGRDVEPLLSTFLDQAGAPLVTVALECAAGQRPRLELAQQRYVLHGEKSDERTWQIPVCARWAAGKAEGRACTVMTTARATLELAEAPACPDLVVPNAGGIGFYHSAPSAKLLQALVRHQDRLTLGERVALMSDLTSLVRGGSLPAGTALAALHRLAPASSRQLTAQAVTMLRNVRHSMVPKELVPRYATLVRSLFGERAHAVGFTPRKGDDEDTIELRSTLLPFVALHGEDRKLQAEARGLADRWLQDRTSISPDVAADALIVAAAHGDRAFFDRLHAAAKSTQERRERQRIVAGLASFRDPTLLRAALDLLFLSDDFDVREATTLWRGASGLSDEAQVVVYEWAKEHFDALKERLPRRAQTFLLFVGNGLCDADKARDYEASFKDKAEKILGGPRVYESVGESIRTCSAIRALQTASVVQALSRSAP